MLDPIAQRLQDEEPIKRVQGETAGVAVIFRQADAGEELLLIRRAERSGDPWSGQVAFPGGRVETSDTSFRATAVRETSEEVGLDIKDSSRFLGYMQPFHPSIRPLLIVPSVFLLQEGGELKPNREVESCRWVRFADFLEEKNRSTHRAERNGMTMDFPSYRIEDYVVWGLTERILSTLIGYRLRR